MKIKQVIAREILDSRGNPTIEAKIALENGLTAVAKVPSGASTGAHEAWELRDGGKRYDGKGVLKAVKHVNVDIARAVVGMEVFDIEKIDAAMIALDGTSNKSKLGANAILAVSLAAVRAGAVAASMPLYAYIRQAYRLPEKEYRLPVLGMNIINGGRHADNGLSVQEFMIMPKHKLLRERVRMGAQIFHALAGLLHEKGFVTGVGDEGGFAPELLNNEKAIQYIMQAIKLAGWEPGKHVFLALDVAASEFYRNKKYYFLGKKQAWSASDMVSNIKNWIKKYPIVSVEDGLAEDDWSNWATLTKEVGKNVALVGDDLFVTNPDRIAKGVAEHVANTVLIKINQIGTVSETIKAVRLARQHNYSIFVSHRSGETADTFIADLAVAVNAEYMKTGSLSRSERIEKYNRLMEIEQELESVL